MNAATVSVICGAVVALTPITVFVLTRMTGRKKERADLAAQDANLATDYRELAETERKAHAAVRAVARRVVRVVGDVLPALRVSDPSAATAVEVEITALDELL